VQQLPPLNPLRVFEVAARLESFTAAADELGVTQSAVSRQIATLEGALGAKLFSRQRHGVLLTKEGRAYRDGISPAFAMISAASAALTHPRAEQLRLRIYTTFAAKWLIKRLPKFQKAHPQINVQLSASAAKINFARDNIDLAIQFGRSEWRNLEKKLLISDVIQPVCSPRLLRAHPELRTIDGLRNQQLLHSHYRMQDWDDWLKSAGRPDLLSEGTIFPSSMLAYEAAAEGLGVAIGQLFLLKDDIAAGTLVPLFDRPLTRDFGYYALWQKSAARGRSINAFLKWLTQNLNAEVEVEK
jgi:LysR family transcriptional regulator, glycine cleavage system transcriptional activator